MKIKRWSTAAITALTSMLLAAHAWAQTSGGADLDVNVKTGGGHAAGTPWYLWAVGIAVFLIIIVAITTRGSRQT